MARCFSASRRVVAPLVGLATALMMGATAAPARAATWVAVPGVSCQAYNNSMADALERSHVRLFNPGTSGSDIWVVCDIPRTMANFTLAATPPSGWVEAFFDATSAVGAAISCGVREYNWSTTAIPGAPGDVLNAYALTLTRPPSVPSVAAAAYQFTVDYDASTEHFFTVTCKLPPGTGINTISMYQQ